MTASLKSASHLIAGDTLSVSPDAGIGVGHLADGAHYPGATRCLTKSSLKKSVKQPITRLVTSDAAK